MSSYGMREGNMERIILTACSMPHERSCCSTIRPSASPGTRPWLGLMQRTKPASRVGEDGGDRGVALARALDAHGGGGGAALSRGEERLHERRLGARQRVGQLQVERVAVLLKKSGRGVLDRRHKVVERKVRVDVKARAALLVEVGDVGHAEGILLVELEA
eukprot:6205004-Pleurochrysis_carterae.AAC.1